MKHAFLKIFFLTTTFFYLTSAKDVNLLCAQLKNFQFKQLSVENGLSSNLVNSILQDREGFYWFATVDGLNRFDGSSVKIFRHNKNDSGSISHSACTSIIEGDDGDIWVATMRGVCRFQKKSGVFRRYFFHHPQMNDDILNRILKLAKDSEGNIWATSYGIWKIDPRKSIQGYVYDEHDSTSMSDGSQAHDIYFDKINNGLWFSTTYNLNFFDLATRRFYHTRNNPKNWEVFQSQKKCPLFVYDKKGKVWWFDDSRINLRWFEPTTRLRGAIDLGLKQKVADLTIDEDDNLLIVFFKKPALIYNLRTNQVDTMPGTGPNQTTSLSRNANYIYKDRNNNKWFGTNQGVYIVPQPQQGIKTYFLGNDAAGYPYSIQCIAKQQQILWLSISGSLYKYNYSQQKLTPVLIEGRPLPVSSLYNSGDSVLWVASGKNIVRLNKKNNKKLSVTPLKGFPYFIISDHQKQFWVGSWDDGLFLFDEKGKLTNQFKTKDGLAYNHLLSYWYDGKNELWLGMNGGKGFSKFDLETKTFENYLIRSENQNAIESNTINALVKDSKQNLWLGTYGGGIYYFDRQTGRFENYRQSDGLSGDYVNTLAIDSAGNLWISTYNGIDFMDVKSKSIFHINESVQLYSTDHYSNLAKGEDGIFFYAVGNKIISINPIQYSQTSPEANLLITGFRIFDKEMPHLAYSATVELPYYQNFFSVEYSALKLSPDIRAQYAYKLEGFDNDWNYVSNRGLATYTNVPPGSYNLLLNATNEVGRWNKNPLSLSITITPPFWKTWWFYLLSGFIILSTTVFGVKNRMKQFKKRQREQLRLIVATQEKEKKNISAGLHDDLGVRLSALKYFVSSLRNHLLPHDSLAEETYKKTMATIDESVEDIRYLLINLSPKTLNEYGYLIAVEDLLNKLGRLHILNISLEQKNMEQRLQPDVEAGLYRITQELINNTLKHAEATSIHLNIERTNGMIQLRYADDGKGFDTSQNGHGYGMENIHTRVALLNGKIEWNTGINQTTKVNIIIPYNHTLV